MKKVLAVMLALVMAFSLCVISFAEGSELPAIEDIMGIISGVGDSIPVDDIIAAIREKIGSIGGGEEGSTTVDADQAAQIVDAMLKAGASKEDIRKAVEDMHNNNQIDDESYQNLIAAIDAAEEPAGPSIDTNVSAADIIKALRKAGLTDEQIIEAADKLFADGRISQEQYDEIIRILNEEESTTDATNEGGIGGFLGGIVDKIKDLVGGNGGGANGEGNNNTPTNPDSYEGKEPTGDTAILSVAAVAAVAGVALVLTKKKQK